jgi:hypothetical protein
MNNQIQIVKNFIEDSFVPLAEILGNHNRDRKAFAESLTQEIADATGDIVSEMSVHLAVRQLAYADLRTMAR